MIQSLYFWKYMVNAWSVIAFIIFFLNFFSRGAYGLADSFINILYPTVLTIYTGQKEVLRWRDRRYRSHFAGESFVILWTLVIAFFVIVSVLSRGAYTVTLEMVTTYLAVLSIYAVTQQSKQWRR